MSKIDFEKLKAAPFCDIHTYVIVKKKEKTNAQLWTILKYGGP